MLKNIFFAAFVTSVISVSIFANELKLPPELMLAKTYQVDQPSFQVQDYWISEKLDGVRAYWNGKNFISRNGNIYQAPEWFSIALPKIHLDGELWSGRGEFDNLSGIVRRKIPVDSDWQGVKFMVFDLPLSELDFDKRLRQLDNIIKGINSSHVVLVNQFKIQTQDKMMKKLDEIVLLGGEGLMLHLGASLYKGQRTSDLLKLKKYEDAEAKVVSYTSGKGKYSGLMGALWVETADNKKFRIGSGFSDEQRKNPPPIGSIITYKYYGVTKNGLPKFASFMRVRKNIKR